MAHLVHCPVLGVWWRWVVDSYMDPDMSPLGKVDMPKQIIGGQPGLG